MAADLTSRSIRELRELLTKREVSALEVARAPEQRVAGRSGREIRQSRVLDPASGKLHLIRVVIESGQDGDAIVTVYRSSKIRKYWSEQ